jgi:hypothetical protein
MADLSITSGSGTQTSTQSPQNLAAPSSSTAAGSSVQPGTATSLVSPNSISLNNPNLNIVNLNSVSATATSPKTSAVVTTQPKQHLNSGLLSISISLFVIAIIIFWAVGRPEKNTTHYT